MPKLWLLARLEQVQTNGRHLGWYRVCRPSLLSQSDDAYQSLAKALSLRAHTVIRSLHTFQFLSGQYHKVDMATSNALDMECPHRRHTSPDPRPAADQRPGSPQSQEEEQEQEGEEHQEGEEDQEDQPGDHVAAMIDGTLAMLEGQQGVGVFCVCEPACECKEVCAVAARHTRCACTCYDAFWKHLEREQPAANAGKSS